MSNTKYGVFTGRFEPFHLCHFKLVVQSLRLCDNLIIIVGSSRATPEPMRNPLNFELRKKIIENALSDYKDRIVIVPMRDYESDDDWYIDVQNTVSRITGYSDDITLFGHYKDDSSFYLDGFPQWKKHIFKSFGKIDSTTIRKCWYRNDPMWINLVNESTISIINEYLQSDKFALMKNEYNFIVDYKEKKRWAEFEPTFVTTDAVVIQSGHVLVIERGRNPGKGLLALPGGFLSPEKDLFGNAIKELWEETNLPYNETQLRASLVLEDKRDHPKRGDRGRTITHVYYFRFKNGPLPMVKAGDDASEAYWKPLSEVILEEDRFYEDHYRIIQKAFSL